MVTPARLVAALVVALQAGLAYAVASHVWPAWTAYLALAGVVVAAFAHSAGLSSVQYQAVTAAARAAGKTIPAPPPMPLLLAVGVVLALLPMVLVACSGAQQRAEQAAAGDCVRCAIDFVPIFTAARAPDGGTMLVRPSQLATDAGSEGGAR